jgi:hypothetical protein
MSENVRYWDRVGMYVTREFAEEWIERATPSDGRTGRYLDNDVEEYVTPIIMSSSEMRREVDEIFSKPFEQVEIPPETQAILAVTEMEGNRISKIKELKAEGYTLQEAKERVDQEISEAVAEILGVDVGDYVERETERISQLQEGAGHDGGSADDGEE